MTAAVYSGSFLLGCVPVNTTAPAALSAIWLKKSSATCDLSTQRGDKCRPADELTRAPSALGLELRPIRQAEQTA